MAAISLLAGEPGTTKATSEYQCRQVDVSATSKRWIVRDMLAPSKTNIYRLGCAGNGVPQYGPPSENLVQNGDMELVQQAGTDGCVMHRMGCLPNWVTMASNDQGV